MLYIDIWKASYEGKNQKVRRVHHGVKMDRVRVSVTAFLDAGHTDSCDGGIRVETLRRLIIIFDNLFQ